MNRQKLTILAILDNACKQHSQNTFAKIHQRDISLTYSELRQKVEDKRKFFSEIKGPVAFYLPNSIDWVVNFLAVVANGQTAVIIDARAEAKFILNQLINANTNLIITTAVLAKEISQVWNEENYPLPKIYSIDENESNSLKKVSINLTSLPRAKPDSTAVILYTSGSTGKPKGVVLTHNAICNSVLANLESASPNRSIIKCELAIAPFSHIAGVVVVLLTAIHLGSKLIFADMKPTTMMSAIKEQNVDGLVGPPAVLELIYRKISQEISKLSLLKRGIIRFFQLMVLLVSYFSLDLGHKLARIIFKKIHHSVGSSLSIFYSAGAYLPQLVARGLFSFGYYINNAYGLSETSGPIAVNYNLLRYPRSVGKVNFNVSIKILNPDKKGVGEICIKSNQLMSGYFQNKESTLACLYDGWFKTGDLGYVDKDRYLYILGREKEVIITDEGKKVFPDDLEEFFMSIANLEKICAFGIKFKNNELIAVCIQVADPQFSHADRAKLKTLLSNKNNELPSYMRAQYIFIETEKFPVNKNGKILRYELIAKYESMLIENNGSVIMRN